MSYTLYDNCTPSFLFLFLNSSFLVCLSMATKYRSKKGSMDSAMYRDTHDDPLSQALMPPKDETPEDRASRLEKQQEATRISREIDEDIQESKRAYERRKKAIKVLLLGKSFRLDRRVCQILRAVLTRPPTFSGQAESGKSTTLKSSYSTGVIHS